MVVDLKMLAMIFIINFAYITLNTIRFMLTMVIGLLHRWLVWLK